jgi:hypothetical protein
MLRETLIAILQRAPGIEAKDASYLVLEGHEVTLYLGSPGRALPIQNVASVTLHDRFLEIEGKERGTLYTAYEDVHAVLDAPPKAKRQSGGTVGF